MPPVQIAIIDVLRNAGKEGKDLSMNELINEVESRQPGSRNEIRSAVLPMISSAYVILTPDRNLRLSGE